MTHLIIGLTRNYPIGEKNDYIIEFSLISIERNFPDISIEYLRENLLSIH